MKKYYALYRQIKEKIEDGEYALGQKLPSKRVMADLSGVSEITVASAYAMLEDEGYILARERSGYYVCATEGLLGNGFKSEKHPIIHLTEENAAVPPSEFEHSVWFKTVRRVLSERGDLLFVKAPGRGCAVLRNAIADYLYSYRGMTVDPRYIIIGSGSEQLYECVVKILGRTLTYGIEKPSYGQIKAVYEGMGVNICELEMGSDGIKDEALRSGEQDVLHVTPFNSFPTGITASAAKRHEYLKWAAEKANRYVVEDDFASEFFVPGRSLQALYSLDKSNSVIYINTFSKSLSPSMRLGYMILPPQLSEEYERILGHFSCTVPVLDQYVLAEFISSGAFERHLNRIRRKMKR